MSDVHVQQLSADLCVAGQLEPSEMAWAAQHGFRSVINNRPDHEEGPEQPTSAQIEAAARAAGLQYAYLPVSPMAHTATEIAKFRELIGSMPGPILAFCRSGARSGRLYRAAIGS